MPSCVCDLQVTAAICHSCARNWETSSRWDFSSWTTLRGTPIHTTTPKSRDLHSHGRVTMELHLCVLNVGGCAYALGLNLLSDHWLHMPPCSHIIPSLCITHNERTVHSEKQAVHFTRSPHEWFCRERNPSKTRSTGHLSIRFVAAQKHRQLKRTGKAALRPSFLLTERNGRAMHLGLERLFAGVRKIQTLKHPYWWHCAVTEPTTRKYLATRGFCMQDRFLC